VDFFSFEQFWFWVDTFLPNHKHFHLVGLAAICSVIWKIRNFTCFEQKKAKSPTEIICSTSSFICYWAGLQKQEDQAELEAGAEALKEAALHFHPRKASPVACLVQKKNIIHVTSNVQTYA